MANIKSIGGNPIVPASVEDGSITTVKLADGAVTDAKLAQTGGVLEKVDQITSKMQLVMDGHNWCQSVSSGFMDLSGSVTADSAYAHTEMIPVSEGDTVRTYSNYPNGFMVQSQRFVTAFDSDGNAISASGAERSYNYVVPSGVSYVVITVYASTDYMVTKNYQATEYEPHSVHYVATDGFIGTLLDDKVDKNGIAQVKTKNIDGFASTGTYVISGNLLDSDWFRSTGYPQISQSGKLAIYPNGTYSTYIMPVDGGTYNFTNVRFAVKLLADKETAVGEVLENVTEIDTTGAEWLAFAFNTTTYPVSSYAVTENLPVYSVPVNWEFASYANKPPYGRVSGSLSDGETMQVVGRSAIKDGQKIVFKGALTSFGSLRLNFFDSSVTNHIEVDGTNVRVKNNNNEPTPAAHGLAIQNDIMLMVEFVKGDAKITLASNGELFTETLAWYQTAAAVTQPQVASTGTVCSYAMLETVYPAAMRKLWYFGDSYISFGDNARWPYYLSEYGFDENALFSGASGGTSESTAVALNTLLAYGTPDVAVFATGMNDGSDGTNPPSLWSTRRDTFLTLCGQNGITPVFCTIPTVPTVNNELKNAWVRASDYRYIDFAAAVGASESGEWYTGMLSSDNVHPTAKGAKALFSQVLIDLPEIMVSSS